MVINKRLEQLRKSNFTGEELPCEKEISDEFD